MFEQKEKSEQKERTANELAGLTLIGRLSPLLGPVVAALSVTGPDHPDKIEDRSSAFEAISAVNPRLASAITEYVHSSAHHGVSFDKVSENASRALFGLPPMTERDELMWLHRHDPRPVIREGDPKNGPTVAEWVAAGYPASTYPPTGYESRSTPEEIAAAVKAEKGDDEPELWSPSAINDRARAGMSPDPIIPVA